MQQKFNWLQFVLVVFVSCVITFGAVSFSGVLRGERGDRGVPGQSGETVFVTFDYLLGMWDNDVDGVRTSAKFDNFYDFFVRWPQENGMFVQGPQGESGNASIARASNIAVQSAVDVITYGRFVSRGAGVIYHLQKNGDDWSGYIVTNFHVISQYDENAARIVDRVRVADNVAIRLYGAMTDVTQKCRAYPDCDTTRHQRGTCLYTEYRYQCIPAQVVGGSQEHDVAVLFFSGANNTQLREIENVTEALSRTQTRTRVIIIENPRIPQSVNDLFNSRWHEDDDKRTVRAVKNANVDFSTNFRPPTVGSQIVAVGNPLGNDMSVTAGIISVQSEIFPITPIDENRWVYMDLNRVMRIDAGINPGNSGGGIFGMNGELVGLAMARMYGYSGRPVDNIAYAIPIEVVFRVADQIIARAAGGDSEDTNWNYDRPILLRQFDCMFSVTYRNTNLRMNQFGELEIFETVLVGNNRNPKVPIGTVISKIVLELANGQEKVYEITRAYQVGEIMIEAYLANSVKIITGNGNTIVL